jgi:voltage-gated potassium channel
MTTILTVGYGDLSPSSTGGRLFTIVFLYLIGFALFTTLVGKGINFAVTNREKKERGEIMYERNNHIVIIDWSHKSRNAIREILRKNSKTEIVVIDTIERLSEIDGNIHYVKGDASNQRVLQNANIQGARAVLIFADERIESQLLADGKSLMIATAIERLAPSVHTTVEIEREEHLDNFRHINIDKFILANKSIAKMAVESLDK